MEWLTGVVLWAGAALTAASPGPSPSAPTRTSAAVPVRAVLLFNMMSPKWDPRGLGCPDVVGSDLAALAGLKTPGTGRRDARGAIGTSRHPRAHRGGNPLIR